MVLSRRDFGKAAVAAAGVTRAWAAINSKFDGVQIGAITYSFNSIARDPEAIIKAMVDIGLGEAELMSNHCEALAGMPAMPNFGRGGGAGRGRGQGRGADATAAPPNAQAAAGGPPQGRGPRGGGRAPLTPEQQEEMNQAREGAAKWRTSATPATWKGVRKKFNDAGIQVALLCYNMNDNMKDEDIEYGFSMAEGLGVKAISTSTTLTMAKRIAPLADKHKMMVGYHGHDQTSDPNQTATLESYDTLMAYGKYNGINLDIGHFTAANYDAVAFIKQHHDKITNLHLKDRKKDHGSNVPWGQGDTPIRDVLQLVKKEKYAFPANIEMEYPIPEGSDIVAEMKKCLAYCKDALA
ncbi:MAG TPA: sugar phosphate isomerase/epimerase [Bryobacteraceae bacterium]|jgi:sugar phosphate isomerase/epimerase|nr:sugar phosphate isomerase/epimerase [Bryobacteraceae bacterium]